MLPRRARLRRTEDIRAVLRRGRRFRSGPVDIFLSALDRGPFRAGFIVPLHGRTAVERNRLKRRLREIVRHHVLSSFEANDRFADLIVRARPAAYDASYEELTDAIIRVMRELDA